MENLFTCIRTTGNTIPISFCSVQLHVKDFCRKLFDLHRRLIDVQLSRNRISFNGGMTMHTLFNDYRFSHNERLICDQRPSFKGMNCQFLLLMQSRFALKSLAVMLHQRSSATKNKFLYVTSAFLQCFSFRQRVGSSKILQITKVH